jgi:hypothetical protein
MMTATASAPSAPGRLGQAIPADELLAFLDALRIWRDTRRAELDQLDRTALAAADPDAYTGDLTLALAVWQAVSDRYDQMVTVWDSGRVLVPERERLSQLIWGRIDAGPGAGLSVSMVEALVLSDALTGRLRDRLDLDPQAGVAERLAAVRAAVERCRDHATDRHSGDMAALPAVDRLRGRVDDVAARAGRGADVGGPLGELEADVARTERDLIVGAARRRDLVRDRERALDAVAELGARGEAARTLAARCTDRIAGAPRLAVPAVANLGPVPETQAELDAFEARLDRVAAALRRVEEAYGAPLAERDELRGRLKGYQAMAQATLRSEEPGVLARWDEAYAILWTAPCDLPRARAAVARYQQVVRHDGGAPFEAEPEA